MLDEATIRGLDRCASLLMAYKRQEAPTDFESMSDREIKQLIKDLEDALLAREDKPGTE